MLNLHVINPNATNAVGTMVLEALPRPGASRHARPLSAVVDTIAGPGGTADSARMDFTESFTIVTAQPHMHFGGMASSVEFTSGVSGGGPVLVDGPFAPIDQAPRVLPNPKEVVPGDGIDAICIYADPGSAPAPEQCGAILLVH